MGSIKKHKTNQFLFCQENNTMCFIHKYMDLIENKIMDKINISVTKPLKKVNTEEIIMPRKDNINILFEYNYSVGHLKMFAKHYKLKVTGTKKALLNRLYVFISLSYYAIKIQKIYRGWLRRFYNKLKGPAIIKRNLTNNKEDFLTFDPMHKVDYVQFFSFKDKDNFIYGFDLLSIYNLIFPNNSKVFVNNNNPYNRNTLPNDVIDNIRRILKISKILKHNVVLKNIQDNVCIGKKTELRILDLFQNINALGNYSDLSWFMNLDKRKLIKFINELKDIWEFRAQILNPIKLSVCPPHGTPFSHLNLVFLHEENNINNIRMHILEVLEKFVYSGIDNSSKILGVQYILCALTLVSESAALALPWYYESSRHN